jgi:DNA-directed RNA polymerase specialized sigma24 family protein
MDWRGTDAHGVSQKTPVREFEVLSRTEFDAAVRSALRSYNRTDGLSANPLIRTRVVADAGSAPTVEALRKALSETVETLAGDPRDMKLHRAVAMTFLRGVPTQQVAAERLGLPFSTYRRHLARGVQRVCDLLWQRELLGVSGEENTSPG